MGEEIQGTKGSAGVWFLKKLFTSPATNRGTAAGFAVIRACLGVEMPMGGAMGLGILAGSAVGLLSFLIAHGIKASHRKSLDSDKEVGAALDGRGVLDSLRSSGQTDDADLLEKILDDHEAIEKLGRGQAEDSDAFHTFKLSSAIVKECRLQAEELQDLVRRVKDPILKSPEGGAEKIQKIRNDQRQAYQAVADARSRLRRGDKLKDIDFLADAESLTSLSLASLSSQLAEETAISKRIEERLRPNYERNIVMEDTNSDSVGEGRMETE